MSNILIIVADGLLFFIFEAQYVCDKSRQFEEVI